MEPCVTTLATINFISRNLDSTLAALARQPDVKFDVDHYSRRIEEIKSIDEFLKDDRVFRFAMKAFGLGDFAYAKAFMRKALTEGTDAPDAFVNQLTDSRYRDFVETFNFHRYGETTTIFDRARKGTIDRYLRQSLEEQEGTQNESVRLALYFQRKAPQIEGPFDILSDRALTRFAYTMLGLSPSTSAINIDKQAAILQSRIDFTELKSPERVARLVSRYAAIADSQLTPTAGGAGLVLSGTTPGIGIDLMLAMQRARLGGFGR
jgi:hypothetical protein